jgi:hypothetical protein
MNRARFEAWVAAALLLLSGAGALVLGQDVSVDLQRYHFYNGWALLHGRLTRDIAPAAHGTYLNPVMDAFHYLAMTYLPPRLFVFLLGALHGLNLVFIYWTMRRLYPEPARRPPAIVAALLAGLGPTAVLVLGSTSGDTLAAVPVLAAIGLALETRAKAGPLRGRPLALAAGLAGAAVGLKLTMAPFALALGVALVVTATSRAAAAATAGLFLAASAAGFLLIDGFWAWQLFRQFGNPFFPYFNQIFRSPWVDPVWVHNDMWQAQGFRDYLLLPFDILRGETARLQDRTLGTFREARFFVMVVLALTWGAVALAKRRSGSPAEPGDRREALLLVYFATAWVLWLRVFFYYRYAIVLEMLAPVVLWILVRRVLPPARQMPAYFALAAALVLWMRCDPKGWNRRDDWQRGGFDVRMPHLAQTPGAIVLLAIDGSSFIIPFFPPETRFFNLDHKGSARFDEQIAAQVAGWKGPIYYTPPIGARRLARLGLREHGHCEPIRADRNSYRLCVAERVSD